MKLRLGTRVWEAPAFLPTLPERLYAGLPERSASQRVTAADSGTDTIIDLAPTDRQRIGDWLEAACQAYATLVRQWRDGAPAEDQDALLGHLGELIALLDDAAAGSPDDWSAARLRAFGGAIEACFPHELQRELIPRIMEDPDAAVVLLRRLRDSGLDEEASAMVGALYLDPDRCFDFLRECADHPDETVRWTLFELMCRRQPLPPPAGLRPHVSPAATRELLRRGVRDDSERVRQRATAYAYGVGQVQDIADALDALVDDASLECRVMALLALGLLGDARSLARLDRAVDEGSPAEVRAALWALARRNDGKARVIAAVEDPRPGVRDIAIEAILNLQGPFAADPLPMERT